MQLALVPGQLPACVVHRSSSAVLRASSAPQPLLIEAAQQAGQALMLLAKRAEALPEGGSPSDVVTGVAKVRQEMRCRELVEPGRDRWLDRFLVLLFVVVLEPPDTKSGQPRQVQSTEITGRQLRPNPDDGTERVLRPLAPVSALSARRCSPPDRSAPCSRRSTPAGLRAVLTSLYATDLPVPEHGRHGRHGRHGSHRARRCPPGLLTPPAGTPDTTGGSGQLVGWGTDWGTRVGGEAMNWTGGRPGRSRPRLR